MASSRDRSNGFASAKESEQNAALVRLTQAVDACFIIDFEIDHRAVFAARTALAEPLDMVRRITKAFPDRFDSLDGTGGHRRGGKNGRKSVHGTSIAGRNAGDYRPKRPRSASVSHFAEMSSTKPENTLPPSKAAIPLGLAFTSRISTSLP